MSAEVERTESRSGEGEKEELGGERISTYPHHRRAGFSGERAHFHYRSEKGSTGRSHSCDRTDLEGRERPDMSGESVEQRYRAFSGQPNNPGPGPTLRQENGRHWRIYGRLRKLPSYRRTKGNVTVVMDTSMRGKLR